MPAVRAPKADTDSVVARADLYIGLARDGQQLNLPLPSDIR